MDFSKLLDELKEQGLPLAEDGAEAVVKSVLSWLEGEVIASSNKYDDLLLAVFPIIKSQLLKAVDKIDGKEG